jgi:uncharacterized protein (TIGR02391 family)
MDPEDLGILLLQVFDGRIANRGRINAAGFELELFPQTGLTYPRGLADEILDAVREAFAWLEGQALLIPADAHHREWKKISRRARRLLDRAGYDEYKAASLLPRKQLHARIRDSVYFNFQRSDYSTAVFLAFREVESAVREASRIEDDGTALMRKAFHRDTGPLTDLDADVSEREARAHLFAGAYGYCRNPHGHRDIKVSAEDAVHMLMLASYLLRIIDAVGADARSKTNPDGCGA